MKTHKQMNTGWFYSEEFQEQAKLISDDKNQNRSPISSEGKGGIDWTRTE